MASDHDRRRLLNFVILAVAMLAVGVASVVASVAYASSAAHRQDAAGRKQDVTISRLNATVAQLRAQQAVQRRQQLASCNAAADLGTVPLPAKPPASKFAVKIITDNRAEWYGLGCGLPGSLPVPAGLAQAAARYRVPVDGKAP